MSPILLQAELAAQQQNWALLADCLQQLVNDISWSKSNLVDGINDQKHQALTLALTVLELGDFLEKWEITKIFPYLGSIAINPIIAIVEDEEAEEQKRWFATRILGQFNQPEAMTALGELIKTTNNKDLSSIAANALANLGTIAIPILANLLTDENTCLFATLALAQINDPAIIEPLLTVTDNPISEIRATAIEALSGFNDQRINEILRKGITDPATAVRKEAVIALGNRANLWSDLDLIKLLESLLKDIQLEVAQNAALSLGKIKNKIAAEVLIKEFQSPLIYPDVKITIIRALGWMEIPESLDYLQIILLENYPDLDPDFLANVVICQQVIAVLGRIETSPLKIKATGILTDLINNYKMTEIPKIKQEIASSLGHLGQPEAILPLLILIADNDPSVRWHSLAALKQLNIPNLRQHLQDLVKIYPVEQGVEIALTEL